MNILQAGHQYLVKQNGIIFTAFVVSNTDGIYSIKWGIDIEAMEYLIDVFHSDFKIISCLSDSSLDRQLPCQTFITAKKFDKDNESLIHKYGKELLASELRSQEIISPKCCVVTPFVWRPSYGVFTELPIYENSNLYYFDYPPKVPGKISFVPDIVIFHQGYPKIIIEVVHKSPPTEQKVERIRNYLRDTDAELHTIKAAHIMGKVKTIDNLKTEQIF